MFPSLWVLLLGSAWAAAAVSPAHLPRWSITRNIVIAGDGDGRMQSSIRQDVSRTEEEVRAFIQVGTNLSTAVLRDIPTRVHLKIPNGGYMPEDPLYKKAKEHKKREIEQDLAPATPPLAALFFFAFAFFSSLACLALAWICRTPSVPGFAGSGKRDEVEKQFGSISPPRRAEADALFEASRRMLREAHERTPPTDASAMRSWEARPPGSNPNLQRPAQSWEEAFLAPPAHRQHSPRIQAPGRTTAPPSQWLSPQSPPNTGQKLQ